MRRSSWRVVLPACGIGIAALAAGDDPVPSAPAPQPSAQVLSPFASATPLAPAEGSVVGARPLFRFAVKGVGEGWESAMPPVIELSQDDWKSTLRVYSLGSGPARGWRLTSPASGGASGTFRCPEELPEGGWQWRIRLDGAAAPSPWGSISFRVDSTPPGEVRTLKVQRRSDGSLALSWSPVTEDVEGKPETVDHYAIYRYDSLGTFPQAAPSRIAEIRATAFVDRRAPTRVGSRPVLYYKVVAVDAAGNELGVRGPAGD